MREKWTWIAGSCILLTLLAVIVTFQIEGLHTRIARLEGLLPYITPVETK